jgi:mannose-6-phosphate isomerase
VNLFTVAGKTRITTGYIISRKMKIPIIKLQPNRVWRTYPGGKVLDEWNGAKKPIDSHFPEDWIGSVTQASNIGREMYAEEGLSKIFTDNGSKTLKFIIEENPEYYFGGKHVKRFGTKPGFLLKYLDSAVRLHIQAHPTVTFSQKHLNADYGKTEGYYILGNRPTNPNPVIYIGFKEDVDPSQLKEWVEKQNIDYILDLMNTLPVNSGDCFLVPGGLPHAIGSDVFMLEVMEPSDFAVRFEFEKGGYVLPDSARFMGRGIDFALKMLDTAGYSIDKINQMCRIAPQQNSIEANWKHEIFFDSKVTSCFTMSRYTGEGQLAISGGRMGIIVVNRGIITIECYGHQTELETHEYCLIAAGVDLISISADHNSEFLLYGPPV